MAKLRLNITCKNETFFYKGDVSAVKIGRSHKCEFNIPREDLSREHCLIEVEEEDTHYITDLGSKNGISINGKKLEPHVRTRVLENATVVLSNIYFLKINALDIKTRADIVLNRINPEIDTRTFQLDLKEEKETSPARVKKKAPLKKKSKEITPASPRNEHMKMIVGFALVLGFVIYQALG